MNTARHPIPSAIAVLIDSREKNPLPFPKTIQLLNPLESPTRHAIKTVAVLTKKATLSHGDYLLENYPNCVIERKGSIREIFTNTLTDDRVRFIAALTRLSASCPHPWLLIEGSIRKYLAPSVHVPCPGVALDALFVLLTQHRIQPVFADTSSSASRLLAGELVLRILCAHAFHALGAGDQPCRQRPTSLDPLLA